jgi:hypothetical protein
MRRLPTIAVDELRGMSIKKLLAVREIADQTFFAEMRKRSGTLAPDSPMLAKARDLQTLVQLELASRS